MRLAYLDVANVFALLRLLPMGSGDKDAEIVALRHQLLVLQRQLSLLPQAHAQVDAEVHEDARAPGPAHRVQQPLVSRTAQIRDQPLEVRDIRHGTY
jgi:hypothetical protein